MSTVDILRWLRILIFLVLWTPLSLFSTYLSMRVGGAASPDAWRDAVVEAGISGAVFSAFFWSLGSGMLVPERRIRFLSILAGVQTTGAYLWATRDVLLRPVELLVPFGLGFAFWSARRAMRGALPEQLRERLDTRSLADADEAVAHCERALSDGSGLSDEQRDTVRLNLARALARRSALTEHPDGLLRAGELLRTVLDRPDASPGATIEVCDDMVDAIWARYEKNGDATGYEETVELMRAAAARAEVPWMIEHSALVSADHCAFRAGDADDEQVAAYWREKALAAYEELTADGRDRYVRRKAWQGLATVGFDDAAGSGAERLADLDRVVSAARQAAALSRRRARHGTDVLLCLSLLRRADLGGPSHASDRREAARLARAWWRSAAELRWERSGVLAQVLDAQSRSGTPHRRGVPIDDAYRAALTGAVRYAGDDAARIALEWAESAMRRGAAIEAADALWRLVTIVPAELRRRYVRQARDRFASGSQGVAAEAGYWLTKAGRIRDAVVAVDYSRAVGITEAVQDEPPELMALLQERGRPDLIDRRQQARLRLEAAERRQFREASGGADAPEQSDLRAELQRAWSDWDAVNHDIAIVAGGAAVQPVPDFQEIRSAAAAPLVYLAAAHDGGYALIVSTEQDDPLLVALPDLTEQLVEQHALRYLDGLADQDGSWTAGLEDLLARLWKCALEPVVRAAPCGSVLVLVPVGALSLLPLHAAGPDGGLPPIPITYAPNARLFDRSLRMARAAESGRPTVLAVDAPDVAAHERIPYAAAETARIADLYGPDRCVRLRHASRGAVLMSMPEHSVWHFACHSVADLVDALDGGLVLDDGNLTVREIMAQSHAPRRLAVLSACTTGIPDPDLLDEVVSFPGALLRAGVATVISTQWEAHDVAASLLVTRFHEAWIDGAPPPIALARAQRWLREVPNRELAGIDPDVFRPSVDLIPEHRRLWDDVRPFARPYYWATFSCTGA